MMSLAPLVLLAAAPASPPQAYSAPQAYLAPSAAPGGLWPTERTQPPPSVFAPQEGDLIFFTKDTKIYTILYPIVRSFHPFHSGIIVRRVTGELCVLEDGGEGWRTATLQPVIDRMAHEYEDGKARIWVRKRLNPLTQEQSRALTAFAEAQFGRPFASVGGLAKLAIPFRPTARSYPDQKTWFCSEIVAQAMVSGGLFPANRVRPQSVTPYDLMRDRRGVNLSDYWSGIYIYSPTLSPPPPGPRLARP
ncbi:MAG TPA: hypothetical protein VMZ71_11500 [Gemmataceae bacterium]|nr:hypothetical protein [Gemmataceae bacterium]